MLGRMRFFRRRPDQNQGGPLLFRRVAVIGVGLIGGSLAKAIKQNRLAREVIGFSQHPANLDWAIKNGVIDSGQQDARRAVHDADLVILATPVSVIASVLATIGPNLRRGCIVTDVGSTKVAIVNAAKESLPSSVFFVGSHPLAGSEKAGVQNTNEKLFEGSLCIMTPTDQTHKMATERVRRLWNKVGANVKFLSPQDHDLILANVSHLPHVVAYALMQAIPLAHLEYSGLGLRDATRIAASSPQVWSDICLANDKNIIHGLDELARNLAAVRRAISANDAKVLVNFFKEAQSRRASLKT